MILYKSLLLIIFLNSFVTTEKNIKQCFYSRYMYYVFTLHEYYLRNIYKENNNDSSLLKELKIYGESLQAQGQTVLLILDELTTKNHQLHRSLKDMMTINLYLNNVSNTILLQTYENISVAEQSSLPTIYKEQFDKFTSKISTILISSISENCQWGSPPPKKYEIIGRNSSNTGLGYDELNVLLPQQYDLNTDPYTSVFISFEKQMNFYNNTLLEIKYLMKPILYRQTYMRYHPKKMLFYDLLSRGENDIDQGNFLKGSEPDSLEMLRNVTLETKLVDDTYPDIDILFSMVQRVFDVKCVKSFQQQVLAATAHPVLSVIGSYLGLVENMIYTGDKQFKDVATRVELFEKRINDLGDSILNTFVSFIRLSLYPKNVLKHLKLTAMELDDLIKYNDKKNIQLVAPKWLGQIFWRCSNPMRLNNLRVSEKNDFISLNTKENWITAINLLKLKVDNVGNYVNDLKKYKNIYHEISMENPVFSHEDMFVVNTACDIIMHNKERYSIQGGSRHKDKTSDKIHLLDL